MKLLVLGGTRFVGRAVITEALARGWQVSAVHRGMTGRLPANVTALTADRRDSSQLAAILTRQTWDMVVDTWAGAPKTATQAAGLLAGYAGAYGYVSSSGVYADACHVDERSLTVDADPMAEFGDYSHRKRGAEIGIVDAFPRALLARSGIILGPHEDWGRLPYWLHRTSRGGTVIAPGRPQRPLQYVDVRDLASWLLTGLTNGLSGPIDVASRPGHATTETLLNACIAATGSTARLQWIDEKLLEAAEVNNPGIQLPCWQPESGRLGRYFDIDTSLAVATGLHCRPIDETVADTWRWMKRDHVRAVRPRPAAAGRPPRHGLTPRLERRILQLSRHEPSSGSNSSASRLTTAVAQRLQSITLAGRDGGWVKIGKHPSWRVRNVTPHNSSPDAHPNESEPPNP